MWSLIKFLIKAILFLAFIGLAVLILLVLGVFY